MHRVVMPVTAGAASDTRLRVSVHVQTDVVAPEVARRRANAWLLEHAGNLLRAEAPELILEDPLIWRIDVILTNPNVGSVGAIGRIEMEATTGKILSGENAIKELIANAYAITED